MFSTYYYRADPVPCYNVIRLIEWCLCCICLGFVVANLLGFFNIPIITTNILTFTAFAFWLITLFDIILTWAYKPLGLNSWLLFAIMGALFFALCAGLLIAVMAVSVLVKGKTAVYSIMFAINIITCIVFLLDIFFILRLPLSEPQIKCPCRTSESKSTRTGSSKRSVGTIGDRGSQYPSNETVRTVKICSKPSCPKRQFAIATVRTHGGTFHMSKDVAPVLDTYTDKSIGSMGDKNCRVITPIKCETTGRNTTKKNLVHINEHKTYETYHAMPGESLPIDQQTPFSLKQHYISSITGSQKYNEEFEQNKSQKLSTVLENGSNCTDHSTMASTDTTANNTFLHNKEPVYSTTKSKISSSKSLNLYSPEKPKHNKPRVTVSAGRQTESDIDLSQPPLYAPWNTEVPEYRNSNSKKRVKTKDVVASMYDERIKNDPDVNFINTASPIVRHISRNSNSLTKERIQKYDKLRESATNDRHPEITIDSQIEELRSPESHSNLSSVCQMSLPGAADFIVKKPRPNSMQRETILDMYKTSETLLGKVSSKKQRNQEIEKLPMQQCSLQ